MFQPKIIYISKIDVLKEDYRVTDFRLKKQILLCVIVSKEIMKGDIISLNRNLLINPDLIGM